MSAGWADLATIAAAPTQAAAGTARRGSASGRPAATYDRTATLTDGRLVVASTPSAAPLEAVGLPAVYGCIRLITHTVDQLPVKQQQGGADVDMAAWLANPDRYGSDFGLLDLIELWTTSLAGWGRAFAWCEPISDGSWRLDPVGPEEVDVTLSRQRRRVYKLNGEDVPAVQTWGTRTAGLLHMPLLLMWGRIAGLGPLQAAKEAIGGYIDVAEYAAGIFDSGRAYSGGYLSTEHDITEDEAAHYQAKLVERNNNPLAAPLVLGQGLTWQNSILDPATAQWIEARQFNGTEVARMYGIPPRYLGLPSGDASTYATARDNDAQLLRSCISGYTNTISAGVSRLLPPGRNAAEAQRLVFDFDAWLGIPAAAPPASTPEGTP